MEVELEWGGDDDCAKAEGLPMGRTAATIKNAKLARMLRHRLKGEEEHAFTGHPSSAAGT